jgi:hypothetical protein
MPNRTAVAKKEKRKINKRQYKGFALLYQDPLRPNSAAIS